MQPLPKFVHEEALNISRQFAKNKKIFKYHLIENGGRICRYNKKIKFQINEFLFIILLSLTVYNNKKP